MFFSVVIPCVNYKKLLNAADSLNNQRFKNFELLIIIYNYQTKSDIIDNYLNKIFKSDINFKIININELNVSKARNLGIEEANGEWICFLDDDDEWQNSKLSSIKKYIDTYQDCFFLFHDVNIVKNTKIVNTQKKRVQYYLNHNKNIFLLEDLKKHNFIITSSVSINKSILSNIKFDENLYVAEDYDLWIRISQKFKLYYLNQVLGNYIIGKNSATTNLEKFEINSLKFFYKHKNLFDDNEFKEAIYNLYFILCLSYLKIHPFNIFKILNCIFKINIFYFYRLLFSYLLNKFRMLFRTK